MCTEDLHVLLSEITSSAVTHIADPSVSQFCRYSVQVALVIKYSVQSLSPRQIEQDKDENFDEELSFHNCQI